MDVISDSRPRRNLRKVGGRLLEAAVTCSSLARVEVLRRGSNGQIGWSFQQSVPTIFWFRSGVREFQLDVDGHQFRLRGEPTNGLCFLPPGTRVEGGFLVDPVTDYTAVFLSPALVSRRSALIPATPMIGLSHGTIERGLRELSQEARRPDDTLDLLVDGWALQTLAHLSRLSFAHADAGQSDTGLTEQAFRRVERYVRDHLTGSLDNDALAAVAGFSKRHFIRAFAARTGVSPMHYVHRVRLEEAQELLAETTASVTTIAARCGFSHAQHLSGSFRRHTGMTPSQFRSRLSRYR